LVGVVEGRLLAWERAVLFGYGRREIWNYLHWAIVLNSSFRDPLCMRPTSNYTINVHRGVCAEQKR
jgi:hypothetical protein